jgi:hypothetical protein
METTPTMTDSERAQLEFYRNFYEQYQRELTRKQAVVQRILKAEEESERWNEYEPIVSFEMIAWFNDLLLSHLQSTCHIVCDDGGIQFLQWLLH